MNPLHTAGSRTKSTESSRTGGLSRKIFTKWMIAPFLAGIVVAIGCERNEFPQGGKKPVMQGVPESSTRASLSTLPGVSYVAEVMPKPAGGPIDGQALYIATCAACHQANGKGVPGAFPPLDGSPYVTSDNTERLAAIMLYGLMGEIKVLGTTYNNVMLPQGQLKDAELAAIATYVRGAWSNKAGGFEATVFAKMREKYGQRAQFNIKELGEEQ